MSESNPTTPGGEDNDETLARLFEEHRLRLLAMAERYLGGRLTARISAEEVLQNAFLRARARWRERPPAQASRACWVYGQVRDQVIEQIRKELGPTRSLDKELPLPEDSVAEIVLGVAQSRTGPATEAARRELHALVHQALGRLKFRDFEVITLHIFDDLTFGQIAEILGEAEDTVARRYRRALVKLFDLLPDPDANAGPRRSLDL